MVSLRIRITVLCLFGGLFLSAQDTIRTQYPNTQQAWEKIFIAGQKVAENIYHKNGTPWMTFQYKENKTEKYKWFHDNGNPFFEATNVEGKFQGSYRVWYENGQLAEQINFVDHLENGRATFFYPNGQLAMSGQYVMGKMTDGWQFFGQDGSAADGDWQWQFAALPKFIRMSGSLNNGVPIGTWTYRTTATPKNGKQEELYWNYTSPRK
ncbi:MAG: hypothetical protein AAFR61_26645 [Bacteroidota bacterium]